MDLRPAAIDGVEWSTIDIRDDALEGVLAGVDVVVHLAFVVLGDLRQADSINVDGSANVFESAARAGCRRVVFASSVAAYGYGVPGRALTEHDPIRPLDSFTYSRTKGAAERALDQVAARYPALEAVRIRPAIILGRGMTHQLVRSATRRRTMARPGRDAGAMQFVHLDDIVDAFRLATIGSATGAFNVAAADTITYRELAELSGGRLVTFPAALARFGAAALAKIRPQLGIDAGWVRIAARPPIVSSARAERELGWRATRTGRQTVSEFFETARNEAAVLTEGRQR
jgi:nucleoside-diphosphate-sugar epimerase